MSDTLAGDIFAAVAMPMCMLVCAFLFWDYLRRRDRAAMMRGDRGRARGL